MSRIFETEIELRGPVRAPRQMLATQEYDGHVSIHDDATAEKLGFKAGPIEGPTHFTQLEALLAHAWGQAFYERGCISSHFQNMVVEGEEVQASVTLDGAAEGRARISAAKTDGTPVLTGTASLGPDHGETELGMRQGRLRPDGTFVILEDLRVGDRGKVDEDVIMGFEQNMGALYPFSLKDKLERATERSPWHGPGTDTPWGRAVIPFEMVSVLTQYTGGIAGWKIKTPNVGLFADLEICMVDGPLFVDEPYVLQREIVAIAQSRRTESYWTKTSVLGKDGKLKAYALLNQAIMKDSYPGYADHAAAQAQT